jgi:hypothetical protein
MAERDWQEAEDKEALRVRELLQTYCLDDPNAVQLCEDFLYISHIWDDIQDKDKERTPREINEAFCKALGQVPMNPFYQANVLQIAPLTLMASLTWRIANRFESGNADERLGSFILRNALLHIIYFVMLRIGEIKGKPNFGIDVGELFWKDFFKGYHSKYLEFMEELDERVDKPIPIKRRAKRVKKQ